MNNIKQITISINPDNAITGDMGTKAQDLQMLATKLNGPSLKILAELCQKKGINETLKSKEKLIKSYI